jgi:hypothetical protein
LRVFKNAYRYQMDSILVRGLDQKTIERLKESARLNGRSLPQEDHARDTTVVGPVEAPARWTVVLGQRGIDPRGSRFTMSVGRAGVRAAVTVRARHVALSRARPA